MPHRGVVTMKPCPAPAALRYACENSLRRGLFVAGSAVDLAGEKQSADELGLQTRMQVARIEVVVFDGVTGTRDVRVLEPSDGAHELELHIERQAGGNAVGIDLVRGESFRLDEDLMRVLVGEAMHLVFHGRTVARTYAFDDASEHRRTIAAGTNDVVSSCIRVRNEAGDLPRMIATSAEIRKHRRRFVAVLNCQPFIVDATTVDARWRAGLEATDAKRQGTQFLGKPVGWRIAGTTTLVIGQADMNLAAQESTHGEHHTASAQLYACLGHDTLDALAFDQKIRRFLLEQREIRLIFEHRTNCLLVQQPIRLRARCPHCRAFAGIEGTKLDAAKIRRSRHRAAKCIDLFYQMAFADTADGRVAAHLPERFDVLSQQQGSHAHPGGRQCGLGAGVAAANHDDIEGFWKTHIGKPPLEGGHSRALAG